MTRAVRPVVPAPAPEEVARTDVTDAPAVVHVADLRYVPDGMTLWADKGDGNGNLVYQGGQLLPDWVLSNLAAGAALLPGPAGVLVLGPHP